MQIAIQRQGSVLIPADKYQEEAIRTLPEGVELAVEYTELRNLGNHRRFFKFINIAFDMQEHYQTVPALRFALIVKAGHVDRVESHKNGAVVLMPRSMAFDKMKEDEFKQLFADVKTAFHNMLHEMGRNITDDEFYQLVGFD